MALRRRREKENDPAIQGGDCLAGRIIKMIVGKNRQSGHIAVSEDQRGMDGINFLRGIKEHTI